MNIVSAATRAVTKTADVTTAAAGAIGGAAVSGVMGGLRGAVSGVRAGLDEGSRSTAAAALTMGAIGAVGLVEWPVLLTVGGAALAVHQLNQRSSADGEQPRLRSVPSATNGQSGSTTRSRQGTARKSTKAANRTASRPAKKANARRRTAKKATNG